MKRTNLTRSPSPLSRKWNRLRRKSPYLLMLFPAVLVVFLFSYLPIYGILIAFQDFMPGDKILSNSTIWVGFYNFKRFFSDPQFWPLMKNTFLLCIIGFLIGFPLPIIVALSINALKGKRTSKFLQTIFTAPHFISLVVLVGMLQLFFGRSAIIYIAALSNVDPQQHEAAKLDGATRFQRVLYVDIPAIMPIISVLLIIANSTARKFSENSLW